MTASNTPQFDADQEERALALIESLAWGDMDIHIRCLEDALNGAIDAMPGEYFALWELQGEEILTKDPIWCCPYCSSANLMMHKPV